MLNMKKILSAIAFVSVVTPAFAQQPPSAPPDPAFMQRVLVQMAQQRDKAMIDAATAEAALAKAQEQIKELETKYEPKNK